MWCTLPALMLNDIVCLENLFDLTKLTNHVSRERQITQVTSLKKFVKTRQVSQFLVFVDGSRCEMVKNVISHLGVLGI